VSCVPFVTCFSEARRDDIFNKCVSDVHSFKFKLICFDVNENDLFKVISIGVLHVY